VLGVVPGTFNYVPGTVFQALLTSFPLTVILSELFYRNWQTGGKVTGVGELTKYPTRIEQSDGHSIEYAS